MDPLYEQKLRDEVIYLHSLWHRGPPRPAAALRRPLPPVQATHFKKESEIKRKWIKPTKNTNPISSPGLQWPVSSPPPPPADAWPTLESKPNPNPQTISPEEELKLTAKNAHQNALKSLVAFLRTNKNSNADSDSDSVDSIGEEEEDTIDEEECKFFDKLFKENTQLRDHYEKSFAKGEFICLVCGALGGKKMGKKYNGCMALVQHSISIAKTKRMRTHRAFGVSVCKVLGWDINNLSRIVSSLTDNPGETQETGIGDNKGSSVESDVVEGKNDEGILTNGDEGDTNSLKCNDADKSSEGVDMVKDLKEPAAHGSTNNSLKCNDVDKSSESVDMVKDLEEPNENGSGDKEGSSAIAKNDFTVESKTDEEIPEGKIGAGVEQSSLKVTDADKNPGDLLTTSSLSDHDARHDFENVSSVLPRQSVE